MDPAPVSAAAVAPSPPREAPEAAPPALIAPGGCYIDGGIRDPIFHALKPEPSGGRPWEAASGQRRPSRPASRLSIGRPRDLEPDR